MSARVTAVSQSATHSMSKPNQKEIVLIAGIGVERDAHAGVTVQHRSRVASDPTQPNLRQVHLIHSELHEELRTKGFDIAAGQMGENITTEGVDLLGLPTGTVLRVGSSVAIQITGLRNPCSQLESIQRGLMKAVLDRDEQGNLIRKAGVMGIVLTGGTVRPNDAIHVKLPDNQHQPLEPV